MSWRSTRRQRLTRAGRLSWRLGRPLLPPVGAVVALVLAKNAVGSAVTAVVGGVVLTVAAVWWWARVVEPRLFAARPVRRSSELVRPAMQPRRSQGERATDAQRHLLFAQALAYVADRYLAECQREVSDDREVRR